MIKTLKSLSHYKLANLNLIPFVQLFVRLCSITVFQVYNAHREETYFVLFFTSKPSNYYEEYMTR